MRTFLILFALMLIVPFAQATAACPTREPTATIPDPTGLAGGDLYVYNEPCTLDTCLLSIWIIQESNGIPGWQPCGEPFADAPDCTECSGDMNDIF